MFDFGGERPPEYVECRWRVRVSAETFPFHAGVFLRRAPVYSYSSLSGQGSRRLECMGSGDLGTCPPPTS